MLCFVNKLFIFKSFLTTPSNVLPLHFKQNFQPKIWIFTEGEADGIKSRLPLKISSTLQDRSIVSPFKPKFHDWFFIDLHVLYKSQTWNCFCLELQSCRDNYMFATCTNKIIWYIGINVYQQRVGHQIFAELKKSVSYSNMTFIKVLAPLWKLFSF